MTLTSPCHHSVTLEVNPKHNSTPYPNENEQSTEMLDIVGEPPHCRAESKPGTQELHEAQKQAKPTSGVRSQVCGCPGIGHKGVLGAGHMGVSEKSMQWCPDDISTSLDVHCTTKTGFFKVIFGGSTEASPVSANCQPPPSSLYPDVM